MLSTSTFRPVQKAHVGPSKVAHQPGQHVALKRHFQCPQPLPQLQNGHGHQLQQQQQQQLAGSLQHSQQLLLVPVDSSPIKQQQEQEDQQVVPGPGQHVQDTTELLLLLQVANATSQQKQQQQLWEPAPALALASNDSVSIGSSSNDTACSVVQGSSTVNGHNSSNSINGSMNDLRATAVNSTGNTHTAAGPWLSLQELVMAASVLPVLQNAPAIEQQQQQQPCTLSSQTPQQQFRQSVQQKPQQFQQSSQQWQHHQQQQQQQHKQQQHGLSEAALVVTMMQSCRHPQQLLGVVAAHVTELDAVAVSAALVSYARLVSGRPTDSHAAAIGAFSAAVGKSSGSSSSSNGVGSSSSHRLPLLLQQLLLAHLPGFKPRQYANVLYALGKMHCRDTAMVKQMLMGLGFRQTGKLKPQELANVAWALGRLQIWPNKQWMQQFYNATRMQLQQQQLGTCHQGQEQQPGGSKMAQPGPSNRPIARAGSAAARGFSSQELANMVWGLGRLHATPPISWLAFLLQTVEQHLAVMTPQQVSNVVWGFAHMGGPRPTRSRHTGSSSNSKGSGFAAQVAAAMPPTFLPQVVQVALQQLPAYSVQEVSCLLLGCVRLQGYHQQQRRQGQQMTGAGVPAGSYQTGGAAIKATAHQGQSKMLLQLAEAACKHIAAAAAASASRILGIQCSSSGSSGAGCSSSSGSMWRDQAGQHKPTAITVCAGLAVASAGSVGSLHPGPLLPQQQQPQPQRRRQQKPREKQRKQHLLDPGPVWPSHLARVLAAYKQLAVSTATAAATEDAGSTCAASPPQVQGTGYSSVGLWQQQQLQQPALPQPMLHEMAALLAVYTTALTTPTRSHRSSCRAARVQQHTTLSTSQTSAYCTALSLLAQLGYRPDARYLSALLEVLYDRLYLFTARDFEAILTCLLVSGFVPAKPWVSGFLAAAQVRFKSMTPEGLTRLTYWALTAEQWFSSQAAHRRGRSSNGSNLRSGSGNKEHCLAAQSSTAPKASAVVAAVGSKGVKDISTSGPVLRSAETAKQGGFCVPHEWLSDLVMHLRAKVACRAPAAAGQRSRAAAAATAALAYTAAYSSQHTGKTEAAATGATSNVLCAIKHVQPAAACTAAADQAAAVGCASSDCNSSRCTVQTCLGSSVAKISAASAACCVQNLNHRLQSA